MNFWINLFQRDHHKINEFKERLNEIPQNFILYLLNLLKYKPKSIFSFPCRWLIYCNRFKVSWCKTICTHAGNPAPKLKNIEALKFFILVNLGRFFTTKIICCSQYIRETVIKRFFYLRTKQLLYIIHLMKKDLNHIKNIKI